MCLLLRRKLYFFFFQIINGRQQTASGNEKTRYYLSIHAKHSDLEILQFLKVARSFVHKVCGELEASDGNIESVSRRRKHKPCSGTVRTLQFLQQVQDNIDKDASKSISAISRDLQVSECTIRLLFHEDILYNSCVICRGEFMYAQPLLLHIKP